MHRQEVVKLSDEEIRKELATLEHWELAGGKLHREYRFENFIEAFAFMTKLALVAEKMNHHPEWSNVYNRLSIALMTHDKDGISNLDIELARAADHYFGSAP